MDTMGTMDIMDTMISIIRYILFQLSGIIVTFIVIIIAWAMVYKIIITRFPLIREILGQKIT